jgi:ribosomal protein S15P/S13E
LSDTRRRNSIYYKDKKKRLTNIENGLLPFEFGSDGVSVRHCIELCQKAYANISIFRNAVDVMAEFANSNIHLEGGTQKSREFVRKWFDKINLWKVRDQYFREYYRSGNVFMYRVDGNFTAEDAAKMNKVYGGIAPGKIPLRYIFLNPYDVVAERATSFNEGQYFKILSEYDLERLQSPKTDYDKQVLNSLSPELRKKIKKGGFVKDGIQIKLDPEKLAYSFYKKQDYEPFAIPFGYPVLDDINYKIELKKIDQAICRTIENVILLITMGAKPDDGGINPQNLAAMQSLFQNESVGRVLVGDYTTKADFIIPDLRKVVGPDKYQIVNQDIKEGLQNIIVGDERYSNTQVKAEIFLERLKESRNAFLHDFLQDQVKMVCQNMGFRTYPTAKFEEIDIKDETQLQRVATRLLELGILTPEQGIEAIKTGIYPPSSELKEAQEEFSRDRERGLYNPLVGGIPAVESPGAQEERDLKERISKQKPPLGPGQQRPSTPTEVGRPVGASEAEQISKEDIQEIIYKAEALGKYIKAKMKDSSGKRRLTKVQQTLAEDLCESIICSTDIVEWESTAEACVDDHNGIAELGALPEVLDVSEDKSLALYPAALFYHSQKRSGND